MLESEAARNASLDNDYGPTRGPNAAGSHQLALFDADGVELVGAGYARVVILPSFWPAASGGQKSVSVQFPPSTGEWEPVTSWKLIDSVTGAVWDTGDLLDQLYVTAASTQGPIVTVTVAYQLDV